MKYSLVGLDLGTLAGQVLDRNPEEGVGAPQSRIPGSLEHTLYLQRELDVIIHCLTFHHLAQDSCNTSTIPFTFVHYNQIHTTNQKFTCSSIVSKLT